MVKNIEKCSPQDQIVSFLQPTVKQKKTRTNTLHLVAGMKKKSRKFRCLRGWNQQMFDHLKQDWDELFSLDQLVD